jgi:exosortase
VKTKHTHATVVADVTPALWTRLWRPVTVTLLILGACLWVYWPTAVSLAKEWQSNDDYSVGQLVPLVALFLIWRERRTLKECRLAPCWWGFGLILFAQAVNIVSFLFMYESGQRYAMVLTITGLVLTVAGWQVFRRLIWVMLFLFLMVPLPGRIHNTISGPLQTLATNGAVFLLELTGMTVGQEGNVILLNHHTPLAVAEACSGLRMLTAFLVVAATLAYLVKRPPWQKAVLLASSVPVAIACNLARLWVTAVLYVVVDSKTAEWFFHDAAGLAMMPLAVVILAVELWLMKKLVIPDDVIKSPAEKARPPSLRQET